MNPLCRSLDCLSAKPPPPPPLNPPLRLRSAASLHFPRSSSFLGSPGNLKFKRTLVPKPLRRAPVSASAAADIDMVKDREGVYAPKQKKVVVLWDLDNKPPRGPPYQAATALRRVAQNFGEVVEMSAYANRHAFIHLPQWVAEERRERKQLDILERKGVVTPPEPYVCGVCGRKCKTNMDLKRHFKQLHERERQKKLNRMRSLKGKKRQKYREKYVAGNHKYNEAARVLIKPKVGYGLASELRRAGVLVKTVEDKPQAADWALKKQMQHSMSRRIDWLFLVSDDSDFSEMLRKAREANLGTVVVGDWDRALGRHADLWVPWNGVENGEVTEKDLVPNRRREREDSDGEDSFFSLSVFDEDVDGDSDLDNVVNELVAGRSAIGSVRISAFSEGEEEEEEEEWDTEEVFNGFVLGYSEDEEDVYF
ncbi:uncharacterized protein LOC115685618 [Syzygium oleosum]|uniref:uncharacterized protein LOC115685618 n=1 Tax=Syzygium oleosum TaxID=219896 RepID=UPI0011D26B55|nr:uncharacterized protein LOC115685618 [Syzygium oleosum]